MRKKLALILTIVMIVNVFYAPITYANERTTSPSNEELKESYPHGLIGFSGYDFKVEEDVEKLEFYVVRRGDTKGEVSVDFKVSDILATYGKDYVIRIKDGFFGQELRPTTTPPALDLGGVTTPPEIQLDPDKLEDVFLDLLNTTPVAMTTTAQVLKLEGRGRHDLLGVAQAKYYSDPALQGEISEEELEKMKITDEALRAQNEALKNAVAEEAGKTLQGHEAKLVFKEGENHKKIEIEIFDDNRSEDPEQFMMLLYNVQGGAVLEPVNMTMVEIADNEPYIKGEIGLANTTYYVSGSEDYARITLERYSEQNKVASVELYTYDETAQAGVDYEDVRTTVLFMPGEESKIVDIPISALGTDDDLSFGVGVTQPISATIVGNKQARVYITQQKAAPYAQPQVRASETIQLKPRDFSIGYKSKHVKYEYTNDWLFLKAGCNDEIHAYSQEKQNLTGIESITINAMNKAYDKEEIHSAISIHDNTENNSIRAGALQVLLDDTGSLNTSNYTVKLNNIRGNHHIKVASWSESGAYRSYLYLRGITLNKKQYTMKALNGHNQVAINKYNANATNNPTKEEILPGEIKISSGKSNDQDSLNFVRDENITIEVNAIAELPIKGITIKNKKTNQWESISSQAVGFAYEAHKDESGLTAHIKVDAAFLEAALDRKWITPEDSVFEVSYEIEHPDNHTSELEIPYTTGGDLGFKYGTYPVKLGDKFAFTADYTSPYMCLNIQVIDKKTNKVIVEKKGNSLDYTVTSNDVIIKPVITNINNRTQVKVLGDTSLGSYLVYEGTLTDGIAERTGTQITLKAKANNPKDTRITWWIEGEEEASKRVGNMFNYVIPEGNSTVYVKFESIPKEAVPGQPINLSGLVNVENIILLNDEKSSIQTVNLSKEETKKFLAAKGAKIQVLETTTDIKDDGTFAIPAQGINLLDKVDGIVMYNGASYPVVIEAGNNLTLSISPTQHVTYEDSVAIVRGKETRSGQVVTANEQVSFKVATVSKKDATSRGTFRIYEDNQVRVEKSVAPQAGVYTLAVNAARDLTDATKLTLELTNSKGKPLGEVDLGYSFTPPTDYGQNVQMMKVEPNVTGDLGGQGFKVFPALSPKMNFGNFSITSSVGADGNISIEGGVAIGSVTDGFKNFEKGGLNSQQEEWEEDYKEISDMVENYKKALADAKKNNTDKPKYKDVGLEIGSDLEIEFTAGITIEIKNVRVRNEEGKIEYVHMLDKVYLAANVDGNFESTFTMLVPVVFIPVYAYVGAGVTASSMLGGYHKVDFDSIDEEYIKNVAIKNFEDMDYGKLGFYGQVNIAPRVKVGAGVGIRGLFSGSVNGEGVMSNELGFSPQQGEGKISLSANTMIEFLFFEVTWEFASWEHKIYEYGQNSRMSMQSSQSQVKLVGNEGFKVADRDYITTNGVNEPFVQGRPTPYATLGDAQDYTFAEGGVYPGADPQIVQLDDTRAIMVFLHDSNTRDEMNRTEMYYSIMTKVNEQWICALPQKVKIDNTPDFYPLLKKVGDEVILLWSSPTEPLTGEDTVITSMNKNELYMAFFNPTTNTFDEPTRITHDDITVEHYKDNPKWAGLMGFADTRPEVAYDEETGQLAIFYVKTEFFMDWYEFEQVTGNMTLLVDDKGVPRDPTEEEQQTKELISMPSGSNYIVYRLFNTDTDEFVTDYEGVEIGEDFKKEDEAAWYGQRFLNLGVTSDSSPEAKHLKSPQVEEIAATAADGNAFFSYVFDKDGKKETIEDQDVVLQIYNFANKKVSHPIILTDQNVENDDVAHKGVQDYNVQFAVEKAKEGDRSYVYMFWVQDGILMYYDVRELVEDGLELVDDTGKRPKYKLKRYENDPQEEKGTLVVAPSEALIEREYYVGNNYQVDVDHEGRIYVIWTEPSTSETYEEGKVHIPDENFVAAMFDPEVAYKSINHKVDETKINEDMITSEHNCETAGCQEEIAYKPIWSVKNKVPVGREEGGINADHTVALMPDGKVLIAHMRFDKMRVDNYGNKLYDEESNDPETVVKWVPDEPTRKLIVTALETIPSITMHADAIVFSNAYPNVGETIQIEASVKNEGFIPSSKIEFTFIEQLEDGTEKVIEVVELVGEVMGGTSTSATIDYTVAENLKGIKVEAKEYVLHADGEYRRGSENSQDAVAIKDFERLPLYEVDDIKVMPHVLTQDEKTIIQETNPDFFGRYTIQADVANFGNIASRNAQLKYVLYNPNTRDSVEQSIKDLYIELKVEPISLEALEAKQVEATVDITIAQKELVTQIGQQEVDTLELGVIVHEDFEEVQTYSMRSEQEIEQAKMWAVAGSSKGATVGTGNEYAVREISHRFKGHDNVTIDKGTHIALDAKMLPETGQTYNYLTYHTSNPKVAIIDMNGTIQANNCGETVITLAAEPYGYREQFTLKVEEAKEEQEEHEEENKKPEQPKQPEQSGQIIVTPQEGEILVAEDDKLKIQLPKDALATESTLPIEVRYEVSKDNFKLSIYQGDELIDYVSKHPTKVTIKLENLGLDLENIDLNAVIFMKDGNVVNYSLYDGQNLNIWLKETGDYEIKYNPVSFDDAKAHWANEAISYMAARGIAKGKEEGKFAPNDFITRAEFTTLLMRLMDAPDGASGEQAFKDVDANAYYHNAVAYANQIGIIKGDQIGNFMPNKAITRQEMCVMIDRALNYMDYKADNKDKKEIGFEDIHTVSDYAQESMMKLTQEGIIQGSDSKLMPQKSATRAETVQMLYRMVEVQIMQK